MSEPPYTHPLRRLVFGAAVAATLAVSVAPSLPSSAPSVNDKLAHVAVYAVNGGLAAFAFPTVSGLRWALGGLLAMGTALELLHAALPGREGSPLDAAANALGLTLGGAILLRRTRAGVR